MKITNLLLSAAALLGFTSCLGDNDNEQIFTENLVQVFNVVEDTHNSTTELVTGVNYDMKFNFSKGIVDLSINGLQLSQSSPSYYVNIGALKYDVNEQGEVIIRCPNTTSGNLTVTDLVIRYRQRAMGYVAIPVYDISYTVNGNYKVRAVQLSTFYFGDTETSIIGTESVFNTDATYYCVTFDPSVRKDGKPQARLFMYNAKFAPKMPEMNLMLLELYADFTTTGYTVTAETAKVYTGTVQNPKEEPDYAVTDLTMEGKFATGVEFSYTAAGRFRSSANCGYAFTEGVLK